MQTVIKGTKTVSEYKQRKKLLEDLANQCFSVHFNAVGVWGYGQPIKAWFDLNENLCLEYENGSVFTYFYDQMGYLQWS